MTPALIASIVTAVVALITSIGLWIKSRANMTDAITKIILARDTTKKERDAKFDNQDIEISTLKKDMETANERQKRLEQDLEKNTRGLKDDIVDLKRETNDKLNQLEDKITRSQESTNIQIANLAKSQQDGFLNLTKQIAELTGAFNESRKR